MSNYAPSANPPPYSAPAGSENNLSTSPTNAKSGFWNSLGRALTNERSGEPERSTSRGRNDLVSTGRGGGGNFVRSESTSRNRAEVGDERGREVLQPVEKITHAGRGGAGNVRSPSRDRNKEQADLLYEEEVLRKSRQDRPIGISGGRGGIGNIATSRSRSREPGVASGRGGIGNILPDHQHPPHNGAELERLEEEDRAGAATQAAAHHHHHLLGLHSHGRGGAGNLTPEEAALAHDTKVAPELPNHSAGRGGVGNIVV